MGKKPKLRIVPSLVCIAFYVIVVLALYFGERADLQRSRTYDITYTYWKIGIWLILFLLLGGLVAFLTRREVGSMSTKWLEAIVIILPSLVMVSSMFLFAFLPVPIPRFLMRSTETLLTIGATLLGCELFRTITKK